jgi:hypothetical protein
MMHDGDQSLVKAGLASARMINAPRSRRIEQARGAFERPRSFSNALTRPFVSQADRVSKAQTDASDRHMVSGCHPPLDPHAQVPVFQLE